MLQLLVFGYIGELEAVLTEQQIIPDDIKKLCFTYYYHANTLLLCITQIHYCSYNKLKLTFNEIEQHDIKTCNVIQTFQSTISKEETKPLLPTKIDAYFDEHSAVICKKNMKLPSNILNILQIASNNKGSYGYNVIFKCGYKSEIDRNARNDTSYQHIPYRRCHAFIYNAMNIQNHQIYQWTLPNLPNDISYSISLAYSHKYGLFTIGGEYRVFKRNQESNIDINTTKNIYNLSLFDNDEYKNDWKWKLKAKLDHQVAQSANCIINNDKQIFIAGGYSSGDYTIIYTKKVRILNMESNEIMDVTSSKYARRNMGIYYDEFKHNVYVGGGDNCGPMNKVECFDLNKNICIRMVNTNLRHGNYTVLWKQYNNSNILNIASNVDGALESIDLRDNCNKWSVVSKQTKGYQGRLILFQN